MQHLLADYRAYLHGLNRAQKTVTASIHHLGFFFKFLEDRHIPGVEKVGWMDIEAYMANLVGQNRYSPFTLETKFYSLKRFYRFLARTGRLSRNPCLGLMPPKVPSRLPRDVLSKSEMEELLHRPDPHKDVGIRDRAILETFYSTGLRLRELCRLNVVDVDTGRGILTVRQGKGDKDRLVPVGTTACLWVKYYVQTVRIKHVTEESGDRLFLGQQGKPINLLVIERRVRAYARQSGITKRVTPHVLRHTCATHLVAEGADIFQVQTLLGHRRLDTSQKYVRVFDADIKEMHAKFHPRGGQ